MLEWRPSSLRAAVLAVPGVAAAELVIGSKVFTESVILGEVATQLAARVRRGGAASSRAWRHARAVERAGARRYRLLSGVQRHAARRNLRAAVDRRRCAAARRVDASACVGVQAARLQQHLRARHAPRARAAARHRAHVAARGASEAALRVQQRVPRARRRLAGPARALSAAARKTCAASTTTWRIARSRTVRSTSPTCTRPMPRSCTTT